MTVLIFDTETTGHAEPVLIEAAGLFIQDVRTLSVLGNFEQRYNPGCSVTKKFHPGSTISH